MKLIGLIKLTVVLLAVVVFAFGCSKEQPALGEYNEGERHEGEHEDHGHGHKAAHKGVLCAIEKCGVGHAEIVLKGEELTLYFVGGHDKTDKAKTLTQEEISLEVTLPDGAKKELVLKAAPMELAGEKAGKCSRYTARAEFLKGVKSFEAVGTVELDGTKRKLKLVYPGGYNPDHRQE